MKNCSAVRLYAALCTATFVLWAVPASAQFQPRPLNDPATGEDYHIEASFNFWFPDTNVTIASEALGIPGTVIDFKKDLGLQNQTFRDFRLVLRPARRHKFRFEFIPVTFTSESVLRRTVVFNGQRYDIGVPVDSIFKWDTYRFAYQFDFISNDRGTAGAVIDIKYTHLRADLATPLLLEFSEARAPVPGIGFAGRVYVVPNVSVSGEFTYFKLPEELIRDTGAHYFDFDLFGTYNFTNYVGAQFGFRRLDLFYSDKNDNGDAESKGVYFGIVGRY